MEKKELVVMYLGCSGFPYGLAEVERQKLLSRSLIAKGARVVVLNRKGVHAPTGISVPAKGIFEGIEYIYTSGSSVRPSKFSARTADKIRGWWNEFLTIARMGRQYKTDAAIVSSMSFYLLMYYFLLSRIFRFKILLNYVEYGSAIRHIRVRSKINNWLFDKFAFYFTDAVLPISTFLEERTRLSSPRKPVLKIPSIGDFEKFKNKTSEIAEPYFLFCGAAIYNEVINFIIEAFNKLPDNPFYLYLIINGYDHHLSIVNHQAEVSPKKDRIRILNHLSYPDLVNYYLNAKALLIPLRPTIQDIARFPHKIAEYTASAKPIITTNVGEIPHYFRDGENALVAKQYDAAMFSEKMKYMMDVPGRSAGIGEQGYLTGMKYFNYLSYGQPIVDLISSLYSPGERNLVSE